MDIFVPLRRLPLQETCSVIDRFRSLSLGTIVVCRFWNWFPMSSLMSSLTAGVRPLVPPTSMKTLNWSLTGVGASLNNPKIRGPRLELPNAVLYWDPGWLGFSAPNWLLTLGGPKIWARYWSGRVPSSSCQVETNNSAELCIILIICTNVTSW